MEPIHSKHRRDEWRNTFKIKKCRVLLSKRELENYEDLDGSSESEEVIDIDSDDS